MADKARKAIKNNVAQTQAAIKKDTLNSFKALLSLMVE